jgi:D-alanyl-D-alanine carboxypeptidase/D-alanyl-D-alanine-endopeptidase (penicillin-binding protein 4)
MSKLKFIFIIIGSILLFFGCKSAQVTKKITKHFDSGFYDNQFAGLLVVDPTSNDTIFKYNANKYFIPASNTKIFTLYTALQVLSNKIPAFKYHIDKDTITIQGTGDPTFLHTFFKDSTALKTAKNFKKVNLIINNLYDKKYGPGWAWEDYDTYFSPERSSFPMYGNVVTINNQNNLQTIPEALQKNIQYSANKYNRDYYSNNFYYPPKNTKTIEIPMVIDPLLIAELWNNLIPGKVFITNGASKKLNQIAYSVEADSLYKRMMHESDNFLAEQILILSSSALSDSLSSDKIRNFILKNQLKDLKQKPRWVDGSGLSRYNLFTPTSFVQVLTKLYADIPKNRLFNLFPSAGEFGTLKNWYAGNSKPYIYAKSGTLENNSSLSGYLITNSGKTFIFSFINNHYTKPTNEVKKSMQTVLELLRDHY